MNKVDPEVIPPLLRIFGVCLNRYNIRHIPYFKFGDRVYREIRYIDRIFIDSCVRECDTLPREYTVEILLVEENPRDVELIFRALRKYDLTQDVHVVKNGKDALDYLFATGVYEGRDIQDNPKVVFLNLRLPEIDGLEVLRSIKTDERTRSIPVVILASSPDEKDFCKCYQLGANSCIVKPAVFEEFTETIAESGLYWLRLNQRPD